MYKEKHRCTVQRWYLASGNTSPTASSIPMHLSPTMSFTPFRPRPRSHSNAKSVCDHPRNLTDAQISAIVHNEGVIGLNLCPGFLGLGRNMDAVLAHIDHFLCMDARENLCLGTDFDGIESLPEGITGVESMEELYEQMLAHRFSEALVQDIFFHNLHRFLGEAL